MLLVFCNLNIMLNYSAIMEKYTKLQKIGEGSFGNAFLVIKKGTETKMVLKEIDMSQVRLLYQFLIDI